MISFHASGPSVATSKFTQLSIEAVCLDFAMNFASHILISFPASRLHLLTFWQFKYPTRTSLYLLGRSQGNTGLFQGTFCTCIRIKFLEIFDLDLKRLPVGFLPIPLSSRPSGKFETEVVILILLSVFFCRRSSYHQITGSADPDNEFVISTNVGKCYPSNVVK